MDDVLGPNETFRTINRRPIYWKDRQDFIHACEGADVHKGVRLLWTLCQRDVPANSAYTIVDGEHEITCAACKEKLK